MVEDNKNIILRIYIVGAVIFFMALAIVVKITNIQWVEGNALRKLANKHSIQLFEIPANKGNIYSADGSLLATTIPNYNIRFDAMAPNDKDFQKYINPLSDSLSVLFNKPSNFFQSELTRARTSGNRFYLLAKDLSYTQYIRIKKFPLFELGIYRGGIIVKQDVVRKHPIGEIASRTIGYERITPEGVPDGKGIEWAFRKYLNGKDGKVLKQKIAKGQWKPIRDVNEVEPQDGYDIISTLDVYIQDIAHHALLDQLIKKKAEHGCVVVMETKTGYIKAISNLGRIPDNTYVETTNYAIQESHEPGSTYKLADMMALLEDKKVDTSTVYNTNGGSMMIGGRKVVDSHPGGFGIISLAKGFEKSSNTVLVQAVYNNYKNNPSQFVNHLNAFGLNKPLGLSIQGEGIPRVPQPTDKHWSPMSLPSMAFGYEVSITPLQTLTFYNSVANNGEMVKPQFVSEIKEFNKTIKKFDKIVMNPKICSDATILKLRAVMENVVKRGTAKDLYSKDFSFAGKTGTAQANYASNGGADKHYISSFVGYFPAENPKYSCIVVVHKPDTSTNQYYGADVAGPVFTRIAQKIFTDSPTKNEVKNLELKNSNQEKNYSNYYTNLQDKKNVIPNLKGMPGMDAVALLGNLKVKVKIIGVGKVKKQSLNPGEAIKSTSIITLELS